jgi:hypothetical protein
VLRCGREGLLGVHARKGASAQHFVAKVHQGSTVWLRRSVRYPRMNRSLASTTDLTCPTDGVILWWLSPKTGADSINGSDPNSVWWCHRCEKSFSWEGVKQIEMAASWLASQTSGRRQPVNIL